MATGVLLPSPINFAVTPPERVNAEVTRSTYGGIYSLTHEISQVSPDLLRTAYPWLRWIVLHGVKMPSFFDDFYNRIHIYPNPVDFGYIASETHREFQVWNAYLEPRYIEGITETGTDGLVLSGGPLSDYWMVGLEAITYTITTNTAGPGITDASYQFNITDTVVALLKVYGTRVIIFPFPANWTSNVIERLEWLTSVLETRDGSETRMCMRQNPRQTLEYEFLVHHEDFQLLSTIMFGWQGRAWGVPLWFQGQRTPELAQPGDTSLVLETDGFEYQVGGNLIFYASSTVYEVLTISAVSPTSVSFSSPVSFTWLAGTFVFPLRIAYMQGATELRKITGEVSTGGVQFKSQQNLTGLDDWDDILFKTFPVLEWDPQRKDHLAESWNRNTVELDYRVGNSTVFDKNAFSKPVRQAEYWAVNRDKITQLRRVLHYAKGQWKPFWAPTFDRDLTIVEDVGDGSSTVLIRYTKYTKYMALNPLRNHIRIQLKDTTVFYREVIGADDVNTPAGTETLTVDAVFSTGFAASDVYMVSFMPLCRLASDAIEIGWTTMTVANSKIPLMPVMDDV